MPSSAILDVAIGIAFVYLFFSLICSVVNEGIASVFALRAKNLVAGINSLFSQGTAPSGELFVQEIYRHGLIRGLFKDPPAQQAPDALALASKRFSRANLPSYIPSRTFAVALVDILAPSDGKNSRTLQQVSDAVGRLPDGPAKKALTTLLADSTTDLAGFQQKVENWFNDSMQRAAGWYKRQAQVFLLVIALVVTVGLNVNTIKLAQSLWGNPVARQAAVDLAQKYAHDNKTPIETDQGHLKARADDLAALGKQLPFPLGWQAMPERSLSFWLGTLAGWLITALALSLGAPFWFDTLNRFMTVRSAIKPKEEKKDA
jgi:hypothetical protein